MRSKEKTAESTFGGKTFVLTGTLPTLCLLYTSSRGIAVRAGLHCAPFAHEALGTLKTGTVRVSFSVFNTPDEVKYLIKSIENIQKNV